MNPPPASTAGPDRRPRLSWHHHGGHAPDLARLESLIDQALPLIQREPGHSPSLLAELDDIEITLLDDPAIAAVHGEFLDDPSPTDVITFHHGEILVSVETAAREAAARDQPALRETALYVIHGLLHLHGHTDTEPDARALMHAAQDRVLHAVWPLPS